MFRRLSHTLPKDPIIASDLESLDYFVNEKDQIRSVQNPEEKYQHLINRSDRVNGLYKEAMNACIREIVSDRLRALGLETLRLPLHAASNEPHVPILLSRDISKKKRVIVLFGESVQDVGIFSYRSISDNGVNIGSAVEFCKAILKGPVLTSKEDMPAIIFTNPAQLLWHRGGAKAVTWRSWVNLPRASSVHQPFRVDPIKNTIPGNRDFLEHVNYIFENVMTGMCAENAIFDIIGLECTGQAALRYLANHWTIWSTRISGICLGSPQHTFRDLIPDNSDSPTFAEFVGKRCRAYLVADSPVEKLMTGRKDVGCSCYSSGEAMYHEKVIVSAWSSMLDWLNVLNGNPGFEEVQYLVSDNTDIDID